VTLRYRVNDALPTGAALGPTANVRIVIVSARFKIVKVLRLGQRTTKTPLAERWKCRLKKGSYRFWIVATDLAGNRQAKVDGDELLVR
jgi:hypothetical protein